MDHLVHLAVYRRPGPAAGLLSCNIHGQSLGISELCAVPWFCCDYIYQRDFRNSPQTCSRIYWALAETQENWNSKSYIELKIQPFSADIFF